MAIKAKVIDVIEARSGDLIPSINGKLTKLYQRSSGTNDNGDWSLQNGELEDSTGKIKIVFSNRDEVPGSFKGRVVYLESVTGEKGQNGLKAKDEKKRGSQDTERVLRVTPTAEISLVEGGSRGGERREEKGNEPRRESRREEQPPNREPDSRGSRNEPRQEQRREREPERQPEKQPERELTPEEKKEQKEREEKEAMHETRKTMMQSANFLWLAICSVEKFIAPNFEKKFGRPMPEAWRQAAAATICIETKGRVPISRMPTSPIETLTPTDPK